MAKKGLNPRDSFGEDIRLGVNRLVGKRLREIRDKHNANNPDKFISQEDLAREVNVKYATINQAEAGVVSTIWETLEDIAAFWGLTLTQMVGDIPTPTFIEIIDARYAKDKK